VLEIKDRNQRLGSNGVKQQKLEKKRNTWKGRKRRNIEKVDSIGKTPRGGEV